MRDSYQYTTLLTPREQYRAAHGVRPRNLMQNVRDRQTTRKKGVRSFVLVSATKARVSPFTFVLSFFHLFYAVNMYA